MIPGEIRTGTEVLRLNEGRDRVSVVVVNTGDRPVQVGSHLHFPDANPALQFDRESTQGYRLDVPAGTSVRLEPGVSKTVELVALGGRRAVPGLQVRDLPVDDTAFDSAPPTVVPFGTPETQVQDPDRAQGARMRVSDQSRAESDPSEEEPS